MWIKVTLVYLFSYLVNASFAYYLEPAIHRENLAQAKSSECWPLPIVLRVRTVKTLLIGVIALKDESYHL